MKRLRNPLISEKLQQLTHLNLKIQNVSSSTSTRQTIKCHVKLLEHLTDLFVDEINYFFLHDDILLSNLKHVENPTQRPQQSDENVCHT